MIQRHRKCVDVTFLLFATILGLVQHRVLCTAPTPVDYLIPPPPPPPAAASVAVAPGARLSPVRPSNLLASESRIVPHYVAASNSQIVANSPNEPGLISRVARWFGFENQDYTQDQQQISSNNQLYYYPRPQQQHGNKEPCNLCNKYPWVPMMHNSVHYPWDATKQNQLSASNPNSYIRNNYGPPAGQQHVQQSASNVKQRAVQFHYPPQVPPITSQLTQSIKNVPSPQHHNIQYSSGPFLPIPIPNLSNTALPPQYNAQPFHRPPVATSLTAATQQLPSTESAHFVDNIASAHSEIHLDTVIPTQIPPTTQNKDPSFEIVKSHQLADYISSVEYPASFIQTQSFDVHSASTLGGQQTDFKPVISTSLYQHATLSPHLNQHRPASQLLTEPGNFVVGKQQQSTLQSEIIEHSTLVYESSQLTGTGTGQGYDIDNYAAASIQQNASIVQSQGHYEPWTLETNEFQYATTTPEMYASTETEKSTTSVFDSTTEPQRNNYVEFIASLQTKNQKANNANSVKPWLQKPRDRETPKRLLDAPIQHLSGILGSPRPFTRDPSELDLRLVAKNHKFPEQQQFQQSLKAAEPTPTSTYSSVDASGQYAGMSPPAMPSHSNKGHFIPFTTKNQPRPFESTRENTATQTPATPTFSNWIHTQQNGDLHTPAETMLVNVKSEVGGQMTSTSPKPRSTKYLTKILASNLRELLQREHATSSKLRHSPNALSIDLHKLQKNIDDWTEQEYTSLSHRPSTPTILGRSKHIPKEFLPSTTISSTSSTLKSQRQSKTTKGFADTSGLPASINSLEPLYDRGVTKRLQYTAIYDNHLLDVYDDVATNYKTQAMQYSSTTTTTTTTTTAKPKYHLDLDQQEPEELWRKAKVSISPKTKEKVYVVTPQPIFFPQRQYETTTTQRPYSGPGSGFKSPRFLIRPTPGNVTASNLLKILGSSENSRHITYDSSREHYSSSQLIPELVGLRGLSAYVPAEPVEINDGNSKVLTIVKPPRNLETTTTQNIMDLTKEKLIASKKKHLVEPSPR